MIFFIITNHFKIKDGVNTNGYVPKPFDLSNITLTREQDVIFL